MSENRKSSKIQIYIFSSQGHKGLEGPKGEVGAIGSKVMYDVSTSPPYSILVVFQRPKIFSEHP